jgi:hypothetical protein
LIVAGVEVNELLELDFFFLVGDKIVMFKAHFSSNYPISNSDARASHHHLHQLGLLLKCSNNQACNYFQFERLFSSVIRASVVKLRCF